jgi:hypothetical protein
MKYFIALLLLSGSMYCQEQVFNVQRYCVDEVPLRLEIFQEMNIRLCSRQKKNDVVFFFTNMKLKYKIMKSVVYAPDSNYILYSLENEKGTVDMKINKQNTKMEFYIPTITFI